jgi:hypothetical protein
MDGPPDEHLVALLAEFAEAREAGEAVDAEAFLAAHPEGGEPLRRALAALERTESLMGEAHTDVPERLGPYRVVGELGRGGVGRVLEVEHDDRPGERLALKLLHVTLEGQPRARERFRREAEALARVDDPGVVAVLEAGQHGDRPFLVMEKVGGESLAWHLGQPGGGLEVPAAVRLVARLARTVHAAHEQGVLHRDLNPRNVLVRPDESPVLIDFGLVHQLDAATLTGSGDMLGTPQYMAPEQARGEAVDARCDVYGLGAILYELLTARAPRERGDSLSVLRAAGSRPLPAPRRLRPDVPKDLDTIVRRATSFRSARRYVDAAALADDLLRFGKGQPIQARPPGVAERAHDAWLLHGRALVAAGFVVLLAVTAWLLLHTSQADQERAVTEGYRLAAAARLAGNDEGLAATLAELADLVPGHDLLPFLRSQAGGELPEDDGTPLRQALAEAEALRRSGRPADAQARLEVAVSLRHGSPLLGVALALVAREAGDDDVARTQFERLATDLGQEPALHRALAELYREAGRHVDVIIAASSWAALAPEEPRPHLWLAEAHWRLGEGQAAARALDQADARGGDTSDLRALMAPPP